MRRVNTFGVRRSMGHSLRSKLMQDQSRTFSDWFTELSASVAPLALCRYHLRKFANEQLKCIYPSTPLRCAQEDKHSRGRLCHTTGSSREVKRKLVRQLELHSGADLSELNI